MTSGSPARPSIQHEGGGLPDFRLNAAIRLEGGHVLAPGQEAEAFEALSAEQIASLEERGLVSGAGSAASADGLSGLAFTAAADELAHDAGLTAADFAGISPSGKTGYTKADVEAVIAAKE